MIPRLCLLGLLWFFLLFFGACKKHSSTRFITSDLVILQNAQVAEQPGFESEEPFPITLNFALVDDASQPNQEIASDFITHQTCTACHNSNGLDINTELTTGANVSPADGWRATLMANAFRDPYFRARLLSEVNVFPSQAGRIQNECLTCHTPMLSAQNKRENGEDATIDFLLASSSGLGRDGISCTLCHQIQDDEDLETAFNGNLPLNTTKDIYGPYPNPTIPQGVMAGFNAVFSSHLQESKLCAGCHVLRVEVFEAEGTPSGPFFTEQATFLEYLNSDYPAQNTSCQDCHMPLIAGSTLLAAGGIPRSPFAQHTFVGGNTTMLRILRDNTSTLGSVATPQEFDQKIQETLNNLSSAVLLNASIESTTSNQLRLAVKVTNLTGHKLPSGYASRRMWLHVAVRKRGVGNLLFESGRFDAQGRIFGVDVGSIFDYLEPHYDRITSPHQVQIYEAVPGDLNQQVTFSLHSSAVFLKDNRIPPQGFTTASPVYAETQILGEALQDPNFNRQGILEGTGEDQILYELTLDLSSGVDILVELCFQAINPVHVEDLRRFDLAEVERFLNFFDNTDTRPSIIATQSLSIVE